MIKEQIRIEKKQHRNMLTSEERFKLDAAIQEELFQTPEYRNCRHLLTYVSFGSEADTTNIILRALLDGKMVSIPKVTGKSMDFFEIRDLKGLQVSKFGVPEPEFLEENRFRVNPEDNNMLRLMLLPGLAFDLRGNRIGYGAGYYDRYLSIYPTGFFYKIALAYDFQIIESIAADIYDQRADAIVTPSGRIQC